MSINQNQYIANLQNDAKDICSNSNLANWQLQKLDYIISVLYGITEESYSKSLSLYATGDLLSYLRQLSTYGHIRRYGKTTHLVDYFLYYPELNLNYFWIPKNACTFTKSFLLSFYPERQEFIEKNLFHETIQQQFSISLLDFRNQSSILRNLSFAIIRHPIERIVSCYIDKFAKPIWDRRPFEEFIRNYVERITKSLGIKNRSLRDSISFREFCYFLLMLEGWEFDSHWRPQADFIPSSFPTEIVLIDSKQVSQVVPKLVRALNQTLSIRDDFKNLTSNESVGGFFNEGVFLSNKLTDLLPRDIEKRESKLYNNFFDESLFHIVKKSYENDFNLYEISKVDFNERGLKFF